MANDFISKSISPTISKLAYDIVGKGNVIVAHQDIGDTATSEKFDTKKHNTLHVQLVLIGSGTWNVALYGSNRSGGVFTLEEVNGSAVQVTGITGNKNFALPCASRFSKIVATKTAGTATVTISISPLNT